MAGFYIILLYSGDKVESRVHLKRSSLLFTFKEIQKIHGRQNAKIQIVEIQMFQDTLQQRSFTGYFLICMAACHV